MSQVQLALTCSSQNATAVEILRRFGHGQSLLTQGGMNEVVRRLADGLLIEYSQRVVSVNDGEYRSNVIVKIVLNLNFSGRSNQDLHFLLAPVTSRVHKKVALH